MTVYKRSLHTFTQVVRSNAKLPNSFLLGIKCEARNQNDGKDYCNREAKKERGTVRQKCGYVSERGSQRAPVMKDIILNLALAYKYSKLCAAPMQMFSLYEQRCLQSFIGSLSYLKL